MERHGSTPLGTRLIGATDAIIGLVTLFIGVATVLLALDALGAGLVRDSLRFQLELVVGLGYAAFGAIALLIARDLWSGDDDGRRAAVGLGAVVLVTFYLHLHTVSILVDGQVFANDPVVLASAFVLALAYAAPVLWYLTRDRVVEQLAAEPAEAGPEDTAGEPTGEQPLGPGEPLQGETLQPDVVLAEPMSGGAPPRGAVAKTTCSSCATPLAVTTVERPVLVECPECGTHGRLEGRPDGWPAVR